MSCNSGKSLTSKPRVLYISVLASAPMRPPWNAQTLTPETNFFPKKPSFKVPKTQKLCDPNVHSIHYWGAYWATATAYRRKKGYLLGQKTSDRPSEYIQFIIHSDGTHYTLRMTQQESFVSFVHFKHREHWSKIEFCKARYPITNNGKSRISRMRSWRPTYSK